MVNKVDEEHAKWLKREGEEFYFYYSADELIATVLEITLTEIMDSNGNKSLYVLCSLSEKHNKFIDRLCYTEILKESLELRNNLKYTIPVKDGKHIIHFGKMTLQKAITIYEKIIDENPLGYQCLRGTVNTIKRKYNV